MKQHFQEVVLRQRKEGEEQPEPQQPLNHEHLNAAQEATSVMVFSDIDFISDDFSVQKMNFLGQRIIQPANDNLNLMLNAVEHLSGNEALMSIRSRGNLPGPSPDCRRCKSKRR